MIKQASCTRLWLVDPSRRKGSNCYAGRNSSLCILDGSWRSSCHFVRRDKDRSMEPKRARSSSPLNFSHRDLGQSQFARTSWNRDRSGVFGSKVLSAHRTLGLSLLLILASGCAMGPDSLVHPEVVERRCGPVSPDHRSANPNLSRMHVGKESTPVNPEELAGRFSPQSQSIADTSHSASTR